MNSKDEQGLAPAVLVDSVSKQFRVPQEQVHTLKERVLHPLRKSKFHKFQALNDVSFAVKPGEFFGIVGRNGSGKSTLLKCLAGIYQVDGGEIYVNGRLSPFIELGVGFNPDLAAEDNIMINAVMLGLTPAQAKARCERVIEFAELQEFTELRLKNYSSGMAVRLAFSVTIEVDADILLIDEVLAVGDAAFQQKCFDVFQTMREDGKTILFVTHDMGSVDRFCDRAMLIEKGDVQYVGDPAEVAGRYLELNFGRTMDAAAATVGTNLENTKRDKERFGDQRAEILEAWFEDGSGERRSQLDYGEICKFRMRVRFNDDFLNPIFGVLFENDLSHPVMAVNSEWVGLTSGMFEKGREIIFSTIFSNYFAPGRIFATPSIVYPGAGRPSDSSSRAASLVATSYRDTGGNVIFPTDLDIQNVKVP